MGRTKGRGGGGGELLVVEGQGKNRGAKKQPNKGGIAGQTGGVVHNIGPWSKSWGNESHGKYPHLRGKGLIKGPWGSRHLRGGGGPVPGALQLEEGMEDPLAGVLPQGGIGRFGKM